MKGFLRGVRGVVRSPCHKQVKIIGKNTEAAVFCFLKLFLRGFLPGLWLFFLSRRFQSYANHTGDVTVLHLEDGTQVWLQDGTELRYAVGKGDGERIVRLDGEAYFDMSHDARHPFVVETRELAIRVLGTAFNVRALAGDPLTEVVLERGAVRLETPGGDNLVRLHPNQRAVYDARMGDMEVAEINAPLYVTRRYNLVTMKGATITEIIAGIEKSYGVRIRIMSPDDGKRYDINYLRSNSLEEVVDIVEFMTGTHCEVIRNE